MVTRAGRDVLTGIDRVELAYLEHLLDHATPSARFLLKSTRGFLLLDARGGRLLADVLRGEVPLGSADAVSRLFGRGGRARHRVEGMLRPVAVDRATVWGLARMVRRANKYGLTYLNTGHSNLSGRVFRAMVANRVDTAVLIHDLIPVTHPDTVATGMPDKFAARFGTVRQFADLVICNSATTKADLEAHMSDAGRRPRSVIAPLGVSVRRPVDVVSDPKAFVMVGTIEPRKNHALMLDVWEHLARDLPEDDVPHLHLIGPRGWRSAGFLARLDAHPLKNKVIFEHGPMEDDAMQARIAGARALLFPSITEGYGLPPLEALALGTLPIVSDLPVLRANLGPAAVYVAPNDAYQWTETIKKHVCGRLQVTDIPHAPVPSWEDHFEIVAGALSVSEIERT